MANKSFAIMNVLMRYITHANNHDA